MRETNALVIFVKTPGISPVKTRLAKSIGTSKAEEFYRLSLRATEARAKALAQVIPSLAVYWAVAEEQCLAAGIWRSFPTLPQGQGGLGERLAYVYSQALKLHSAVCFMGADSPHISVKAVAAAVAQTLERNADRFQLGETSDGGFYFFGGGIEIPAAVWESVEYSSANTARELRAGLEPYGRVDSFAVDFDIDTEEDLLRMSGLEASGLLQEQAEVIEWGRKLHE